MSKTIDETTTVEELINALSVIESDKAITRDRRGECTLKKKALESELVRIKNQIRSGGRMASNVYSALCAQQTKTHSKMRDIDMELMVLKARSSKLHADADEIKQLLRERGYDPFKKSEKVIATYKIRELRDKYMEFAEDQTRINSMRVMGAQVANDLTQLLDGLNIGHEQ